MRKFIYLFIVVPLLFVISGCTANATNTNVISDSTVNKYLNLDFSKYDAFSFKETDDLGPYDSFILNYYSNNKDELEQLKSLFDLELSYSDNHSHWGSTSYKFNFYANKELLNTITLVFQNEKAYFKLENKEYYINTKEFTKLFDKGNITFNFKINKSDVCDKDYQKVNELNNLDKIEFKEIEKIDSDYQFVLMNDFNYLIYIINENTFYISNQYLDKNGEIKTDDSLIKYYMVVGEINFSQLF